VSIAPLRSAPAQNALPAPVGTTTRTRSSSERRPNAISSSPAISFVNALSRDGRFRVTVAIDGDADTTIVLNLRLL